LQALLTWFGARAALTGCDSISFLIGHDPMHASTAVVPREPVVAGWLEPAAAVPHGQFAVELHGPAAAA
jgi:hypothetical protein